MIRDNNTDRVFLGSSLGGGAPVPDTLRGAWYQTSAASLSFNRGVLPSPFDLSWTTDTAAGSNSGFYLSGVAPWSVNYTGPAGRLTNVFAAFSIARQTAAVGLMDIRLVKNGVVVDASKVIGAGSLSAYHSFNLRWPIVLDTSDTVQIYFSNLSGTSNIIVSKGRIGVG